MLTKAPNMAEDNRLPRFAILIDADNTSPRIAAGLPTLTPDFKTALKGESYQGASGAFWKSVVDIFCVLAI
jgi:hypothetical protein